jgi:transcriptional regulator with XRE-family HTH domain
MHLGRVLRQAREDREISQEDLAARSGVQQSAISAYERERRVPGWHAAERLFAAMGLQMRIGLEPLDTDIDAQIDQYAALSQDERVRQLPSCLQHLDEVLAGVPLVVTGAAAAALHGVPVPVRRIDLLVPDTDAAVDALCAQLRQYFSRLWDPKPSPGWARTTTQRCCASTRRPSGRSSSTRSGSPSSTGFRRP